MNDRKYIKLGSAYANADLMQQIICVVCVCCVWVSLCRTLIDIMMLTLYACVPMWLGRVG